MKAIAYFENYRILWEWLGQGSIGLWRVGKHDFVDAFTSLPGVEQTEWVTLRTETVQSVEPILDWRNDLDKPQPFKHFPTNHLRLFGVPDEYLDAVRTLNDPETIWDLTIPENVQYTLYNLLRSSFRR